jgi:glycosyltransferase involved in cell wall biosynthesis
MISIIICSRNPDISDELKQNIAKTIGVEYELIVIDNSKNKYTIFSAYNEGVRRAQYPYLCFMHDDILYHTDNWGTKVIEHFKDEKIGLIGVIGGHYMPKCPASWWSAESRSGQIIQGFINEKNEYETELYKYTNNKKNDCEIIEVASIDGLWFCIPKQSFLLIMIL